MKIKELSKNKNKIIPREEIEVLVIHKDSSQPKRFDVRDKVSAKMGLKLESTVVKKIKPSFGQNESKALIHSYKTKKDLEKFEPKYILKRNKKPEQVKKEDDSSEEKASAESN